VSESLQALAKAAQIAERQGNQPQAIAYYQQLLQQEPSWPNGHFRLGLLLSATDPFLARSHFEAELALHPDFGACHMQLALLCAQAQQWQEALTHGHRALSHLAEPRVRAQAWVYLGQWHQAAGELPQAQTAWEEALRCHPRPDIHRALARLYRDMGEPERGLKHLQTVAEQQGDAGSWWDLGILQQACHQFLPAAQSFAYSRQQAPQAISYLQEAFCRADSGDITQAQTLLNQGQNQAKSDGLALAQLSLFPVVYRSEAEAQAWEHQWFEHLKALEERELRIQDPIVEVGRMPFYLPFLNLNCRSPLWRWGQVLLRAWQAPPLPEPAGHKPGTPLRVGVVSRFFHQHSVMDCLAEVFCQLTHSDLELHAFSIDPLLEDQVTLRLKHTFAQWHVIQGPLEQQLSQIRAAAPHVLLYTDLGTDLNTWLLASQRLAARQYVYYTQPVTSGLSHLDGMLSWDLGEHPEADAHYTEPLLRWPVNPHCYRRPPQPIAASRAFLGLPEGPLYVCPVNLFKLHPNFDAVFAGILAASPHAHILLLARSHTHVHQVLQARLQARLGPLAQRIIFRPWYSRERFTAVLQQATAFLDTHPFGSGITLLQAIAAGTPIVSMPSVYMRGRFAQVFAQLAHEQRGICATPEAQIAVALSLQDPVLRAEWGERVQHNSAILFEQASAADYLQTFLGLY
jgi:protein O-GlcNAc transferase